MTGSNLILHCGARIIDRAELQTIELPKATDTWTPVAHDVYLATVLDLIKSAGFGVKRERLALANGRTKRPIGTDGATLTVPGGRFFGVLDLETSLGTGVGLSVGLRNSLDQSFAMSFVAGSRTVVCDNLAFSGELLVSRKHTRFGLDRLREAVTGAVGSLEQFAATERNAIARMRDVTLSAGDADHLILEGFRRGITSGRTLPAVLAHWEDPTEGATGATGQEIDDHAELLRREFGPRNAWTLYNAHTSAFADLSRSQPNRHADLTMQLRGMFSDLIGAAPPVTTLPIPIIRDED
jgi:hypothetical protein